MMILVVVLSSESSLISSGLGISSIYKAVAGVSFFFILNSCQPINDCFQVK